MFIHLMFIILLFGVIPATASDSQVFDLGAIFLGTVSLILSHWVSYQTNFIQKSEYKEVTPHQLFFSPYRRIIVMHMTVIFGGLFVQSTGQSVGALTALVFYENTN